MEIEKHEYLENEGEKEGKMEIEKHEYLENEENFLDETKNIFHGF